MQFVAVALVLVTVAGGLVSVGGNPLGLRVGTVGGGPSGSAQPPILPALASPSSSHLRSTPSGSPYVPNGSDPVVRNSDLSSLIAQLPRPTQQTPWVQALIHPGTGLVPLTSLPNLELLAHPGSSVAGQVYPGYVSEPAPLGLADYGLGASPFSYNTSHFLGQVTFYSPPNASDPGASALVQPGGSHLGFVGSLYEFSVQLNTVATDISIPGVSDAYFWTQNVVDWNDTGIHFLSDTFNMTSTFVDLRHGTIYSGCNNSTAGVDKILNVYGGVLQCVGGTLPVGPASYPVTLDLYNNVSVNAQNRVQVAYGYRLDEAGSARLYTGVSDTVVFNSPGAPGNPPARPPEFSVDGFATTPTGLLRDAELVLVGDIGGDNAVFRSANGTLQLEYSNASSGAWRAVPSAYNFGADTGETSNGIADYWTAAHALVVHQGPTMLYGLWNADPRVSVAAGAIRLVGSVVPSYAFVFVSNTPPAADPFATGAPDNMSWLPTTDSGHFATYLPPLGAPWTSAYYVEGFADGSRTTHGPPVTGNETHYTLTLPSAPHWLGAPLYMYSNAQAASLARNVSGSSTAPYVFDDLTDAVNFTFNRLNDYFFPTFELVMVQGVSQPVVVSGAYQAPDWPVGNFYFLDYAISSGILSRPPIIFGPLAGYTSQINVFGGTDDQVTNETFAAPFGQGGAVVLWKDTDAVVESISSLSGAEGVWVGESTDTLVEDLSVNSATGVEDIGSAHTSIEVLTVTSGEGIEAFGSVDGEYGQVSVSEGIGITVGLDSGNDPYYFIPGTRGLSIEGVEAAISSLGVQVTLSSGTTISDVSAYGGAAVALEGTTETTVHSVTAQAAIVALELYDTLGTVVTHVGAYADGFGIVLFGNSSGTVVSHSDLADCSGYGVFVQGGTGNEFYDNIFFANDNSTVAYRAAHVQAYGTAGTTFDGPGRTGNYWSDWHARYPNGTLEPYPVASGVADYFPQSDSPYLYTVTFDELGLPAEGQSWSVGLAGTLERAVTSPTGATVPSLSFTAPNGTYPYVATGGAGYAVFDFTSQQHITVDGRNATYYPGFVPGGTYSLTIREAGLRPGTLWCAEVGAISCSTKPWVRFSNLTAGNYTFSVVRIPGMTALAKLKGTWTVAPSHSELLRKSAGIRVRFAYAVTFTEEGLQAGQGWGVTAGGYTGRSISPSAVVYLPNGTFAFRVLTVAGYTSAPRAGRITVDGTPLGESVRFTLR